MDQAYVDKLAKDINGVKNRLVRQDLFDSNVDAKGMNTTGAKETVRAFLSMITKKSQYREFWVEKGTEFDGEFKKLCKPDGIQFYCTMNETIAAFAERTIRSLKNLFYRYMKEHGYTYIHKLCQFVTALNSRNNCSINLIPTNIKNSDICPFCTASYCENIKKPNLRLETELASTSMTHLSRMAKRTVYTGKCLKLLQFLPEYLQHAH